MIFDCDGNVVVVGDKVKLLHLDEAVLRFIPDAERKDVASMVGDVLEVYDIRGDFLCVEKSWRRGKGKTEYHMITVKGNDVRLEIRP